MGFTDVPEIEVLIVDRPDVTAAGAGEAPIITVAPAIASAIFAATGQRLRRMPLIPEGQLPRSTTAGSLMMEHDLFT